METGDSPDAPLLLISTVLGNASDGDWSGRLDASRIDVLTLDAAEAQRSRLRKRTMAGVDVALGLERGVQLRDGDVLHWDQSARAAVVARVDLGDVLVIDLSGLLAEPVDTLISRCVEVGHAVGNQHWPAVMKASRMYVPLTVAREVMESVLETHRIEGVSWCFARGADVLPHLAQHEARLLFAGGAGGSAHAHAAAPRYETETR